MSHTFVLHKERRNKKKAELSSPPLPPLSKPKAPKRKAIIPQSEEEDEEEEEKERWLKRQPRDTSHSHPPSVPPPADTMDQPLSFESSQPATADHATQPSIVTAAIPTNLLADTISS